MNATRNTFRFGDEGASLPAARTLKSTANAIAGFQPDSANSTGRFDNAGTQAYWPWRKHVYRNP